MEEPPLSLWDALARQVVTAQLLPALGMFAFQLAMMEQITLTKLVLALPILNAILVIVHLRMNAPTHVQLLKERGLITLAVIAALQ